MIAHLRGTAHKGKPGTVEVDVAGVGYRVAVPLSAWDTIGDGQTVQLFTTSYVREDRFDLYGFLDRPTRSLFESLIELQGIGPKMGLELCDVPRNLLQQAMDEDDAKLLTNIKGIGKKTAEKLLIELKSLAEREPEMFRLPSSAPGSRFDRDAIAALAQLGYGTAEIMEALDGLPPDLRPTDARVTAPLRMR